MNHKGQTLVMFVIIIPIIIILLAFVVDTGYIMYENIRIKGVTTTILETTFKNHYHPDYKTQVQELFQKNNVSLKNSDILIENDVVTMKMNTKIESIFGSIIGIKEYKIKLNMKAYEKNNHVIVEKE